MLLDAVLSRLGLGSVRDIVPSIARSPLFFRDNAVTRFLSRFGGTFASFERDLEWTGFLNKDERTRESKLEKCYFKFIFFFFL